MTLGAMFRVESRGESEEGKRIRLEVMRRSRKSGQAVDEEGHKGFESVL